MQPFLLAKKPEIEALCRKYHVAKLWVFGSVVRDDFDPEHSDVDFVVEFKLLTLDEYVISKRKLESELESTLGRSIDLLSSRMLRGRLLDRVIVSEQEELYAAA